MFGYIIVKYDISGMPVIKNMLQRWPRLHKVSKMLDAIHYYNNSQLLLLKAIGYSILGQLTTYVGIGLLGSILEINMSILTYLLVLPMCMIVNAIPVAPGGLGVGEIGFATIFQLFGAGSGAELAVLFHLVFFLFATGLGGVIYAFSDFSQIAIVEKGQ